MFFNPADQVLVPEGFKLLDKLIRFQGPPHIGDIEFRHHLHNELQPIARSQPLLINHPLRLFQNAFTQWFELSDFSSLPALDPQVGIFPVASASKLDDQEANTIQYS